MIDDDLAILNALKLILEYTGYDVATATNGKDAIHAAKIGHFDLAMTDLKMPGISGLETLAELKKLDSALPVIIASGFITDEVINEYQRLGAFGYIRKPFGLDEVLALVRQALGE